VRTEQVPWARPGARLTRDFEDVIGWLAQRADKTTVAQLLGCAWETIDRVAKRLVHEHLDDTRLDNLYRIGIDEISYKRGHKYLPVTWNLAGRSDVTDRSERGLWLLGIWANRSKVTDRLAPSRPVPTLSCGQRAVGGEVAGPGPPRSGVRVAAGMG
jgi:hypothetical protein